MPFAVCRKRHAKTLYYYSRRILSQRTWSWRAAACVKLLYLVFLRFTAKPSMCPRISRFSSVTCASRTLVGRAHCGLLSRNISWQILLVLLNGPTWLTSLLYMSGFMKTARKNSTCAFSGLFFYIDDIKIKSKVSAFFLPLPVYLLFIALLSLLFAHLQGLKKA